MDPPQSQIKNVIQYMGRIDWPNLWTKVGPLSPFSSCSVLLLSSDCDCSSSSGSTLLCHGQQSDRSRSLWKGWSGYQSISLQSSNWFQPYRHGCSLISAPSILWFQLWDGVFYSSVSSAWWYSDILSSSCHGSTNDKREKIHYPIWHGWLWYLDFPSRIKRVFDFP